MSRSNHDQRGYTIIELVVAMTIFAVVVVVAVGAFVSVQRTAQKTAAQRKVQQDTRYNLEQLTRQTRAGRIDYGFYLRNANDTRCNVAGRQMLALFVTDASSPAPKRVFFFYAPDPSTSDQNDKTLFSLTQANLSAVPTCGEVVDSAAKAKQVADGVTLTDLQFFVLPVRDPLNTAESDPIVRNTHPRVTVLWTAQTGSMSQNATYNQDRLQVTISTRAYPISQPAG